MKPFEEQFTAWVDGKLTGPELAAFEQELEARPEALQERASTRQLGELLRRHAATPPLTNADFFNLQLQQRIEAETPPTKAEAKAAAPKFAWPLSRLAWGGAFCLFMAAVLFKALIPMGSAPVTGPVYFAQVVEAWPADPSISATTVYNAKDNVTVLWLDGLDYIPASQQLQ